MNPLLPRGISVYIAGLLLLVVSCVLSLLIILYGISRIRFDVAVLMLVNGALFLAAGQLLATGLYQMLVHLYHTISRTDPAHDRPLRGRTIYICGQLGTTIFLPITVFFAMLAGSDAAHPERETLVVLFAVLPGGFCVLLVLAAYFVGLGIMVRDIFLRHRDIAEKREAERRRRLEEADEPQTEILTMPRPTAEELRQHIREER
jgi:hypothetical protein